MKPFANYKDLFWPVLGVSFISHFTLLGLGLFAPPSPQVSVVSAPNTMQVVIIEETIPVEPPEVMPPPIIEEVMAVEQAEVKEEVVVIEPPEKIIEPIEEVPEEISEIVELPEEIELEPMDRERQMEQAMAMLKEIVKKEHDQLAPVYQEESLGAQSEAKPLEYINDAPSYPRLARQRGWQRQVMIKVRVDRQGFPISVEVDQSSGYRVLDKAAVTAVNKWRFEPARRGSKTFESDIIVPVTFVLK